MSQLPSATVRHPLVSDPFGRKLSQWRPSPKIASGIGHLPPRLHPIRSLDELRTAPYDENLIYRLARAARTGPYLTRGDRVLEMMFSGGVTPTAPARWVIDRLRAGMAAASVAQDVSAARLASQWADPRAREALSNQLTTSVLVAARRLTGPAPLTKGAVPMTIAEYHHLLCRGSTPCRQALAICWLRAARTADVLALRAGSLWMEGAHLSIELGAEKARKLGLPGFVTVTLPAKEKLLLQPLLAPHRPTTAPATRPKLLPLTYPEFREYIINNRPVGSKVTPHSLRKGAVMRMLQAGESLASISLITQHRSVTGLMAYVTHMDHATRAKMLTASAAIGGTASS